MRVTTKFIDAKLTKTSPPPRAARARITGEPPAVVGGVDAVVPGLAQGFHLSGLAGCPVRNAFDATIGVCHKSMWRAVA